MVAAVAQGGIITFNCGGGAVSILVTSQINLPINISTTIDGANLITLNGQGTGRILIFNSPNFQATHTLVTLQNLTFTYGSTEKSGQGIVAPTPCSQGYQDDTTSSPPKLGSGGAIYVRDGILNVIDSNFTSNNAAQIGPDVAGGNGGAVYIDGGEVFSTTICGTTFSGNTGGMGGTLGGAIFRTPDNSMQTTTLDRDTFQNNTSDSGGGVYFHNSNLVVTHSTFAGNTARNGNGGGMFTDGSNLTFTNDTFYGNTASVLGGAFTFYNGPSNTATVTNVTMDGNTATVSAGGSYPYSVSGGTVNFVNLLYDATLTGVLGNNGCPTQTVLNSGPNSQLGTQCP